MSTIARLIEAFGTTKAMTTIERWIESLGSTVVTHEKTAVFRLSASRIWELVEGPAGLCQWDEQVVSMVPATPADEGPQHVGTCYRVRSWAGADEQINDRIEEVTGFDPPHLRRIQCRV